jgi:RND family efflux transporter MFP subunit
MKNLNTRSIVIIALGALGIGIMIYVMPPSKPKPATAPGSESATQKAALTVTSALPQAASLPIRLTANGNVVAWQEASIGSELNGLRLEQVRVNVGDKVRAGQVLAVLSSAAIKADVAQARATLMEAQANAVEAQANVARARTLESTGALSAQQISQYMTTAQAAEARIASATAALTSQQLRLSYTQLVAPDDGVISARTASVGTVVSSGAELFKMIRQGRLEWRAEVIASELGRIQIGTTALVTASNGSTLTGRVRMIAPTVDAQTRIALVYVDLPDPAPKRQNKPNKQNKQDQQQDERHSSFKAGMFASGQFALGNSDAMTVAQQSVVVRDGFSYVFRLNPDQRVNQVKITPGRRVGERIEVVSGITPQTNIVVAGAGFLNEGDLVNNVESAPPVTVPVTASAPGAAAGSGSASASSSAVAAPLAR